MNIYFIKKDLLTSLLKKRKLNWQWNFNTERQFDRVWMESNQSNSWFMSTGPSERQINIDTIYIDNIKWSIEK